MATPIFPAHTGDIILPEHVDLLATSQAWLGVDSGTGSIY